VDGQLPHDQRKRAIREAIQTSRCTHPQRAIPADVEAHKVAGTSGAWIRDTRKASELIQRCCRDALQVVGCAQPQVTVWSHCQGPNVRRIIEASEVLAVEPDQDSAVHY